MKFCSQCGATVSVRVPEGDNLPRYVCDSCNTIHYQNPKIVAGCVPVWNDQVLLCRRAIEPRHGFWTLPAGFMENGETTQQAAARETEEEANAKVHNLTLYGVYNLPHISQVYMMFLANMIDGVSSPGMESLEVELFSEKDIPWSELAFPVVDEILRMFFQDRSNSTFPLHFGDIVRNQDRSIDIIRY